MGNCASHCHKQENYSPDVQSNKLIDKQIKADERKFRSEVKLLLLGIIVSSF